MSPINIDATGLDLARPFALDDSEPASRLRVRVAPEYERRRPESEVVRLLREARFDPGLGAEEHGDG